MQTTKAELEKIEISGYKKIHEKCRDQIQPKMGKLREY
ncbi:hypothetical protein A1E_01795 [Rickettsia canadensis str. McKiel]|uniref:Uncharacterized protein n=1 Tax=Rickettsia canadensis (strain McKiel) TaxID=293613 RepID=A8EY71_RICCK|nr:hypothetical protein A1E_01795 [Rickettsia canadensis str. McKiel]